MALVKIDFFRVVLAAPNVNLAQILNDAFALPLPQRNYDRDHGPYRLQEFQVVAGGTFEGEVLQTRLDRGASLSRVAAAPEPVQLEEDQGLAETQAFIYNPRLHLLAFERNINSGTSKAFVDYVANKAPDGRGIDLFPVLKQEAYQRIMAMHEYKSIEVSIASPRHLGALEGMDLATRQVAQMSEQLGAGYMKIALSCGHQQEPLARNAVQQFIQSLHNRPEVRKIHVKGVNADEVTDALDLLDYKLTAEEEIQAGQYRQVPYGDRIAALRRMINANLQELEVVLGEPAA